ncbi:hypothetical protein SAMN04490207_3385 [Pseudomonas gessardii]|uniref:hypothetical protein n=1 Tax=Pseudomonas gessardii TaxID=78544 RepID=UPI00087E6A96|nr:hypothetical protein [Pseudomonas gessardii]MRU50211.1 hypothetical protein [Pseudomonas gessardii]SDR11445.1 hypothetical protein SAMN04490207_3385 [Pseudomonas gessardii]
MAGTGKCSTGSCRAVNGALQMALIVSHGKSPVLVSAEYGYRLGYSEIKYNHASQWQTRW